MAIAGSGPAGAAAISIAVPIVGGRAAAVAAVRSGAPPGRRLGGAFQLQHLRARLRHNIVNVTVSKASSNHHYYDPAYTATMHSLPKAKYCIPLDNATSCPYIAPYNNAAKEAYQCVLQSIQLSVFQSSWL